MPSITTVDHSRRALVRIKTQSSTSQGKRGTAEQLAVVSAPSHRVPTKSKARPAPEFRPVAQPSALPEAPATIGMYPEDALIWYFVRNYKRVTCSQLRILWNVYIYEKGGGPKQLPTILDGSNNNRLFERNRYIQRVAIDVLSAKEDWIGVSGQIIAVAARASLDDACRYECNVVPAREGSDGPLPWTSPDRVAEDWSGVKEMRNLEYTKWSGQNSIMDIFTGPQYSHRLGWARSEAPHPSRRGSSRC